ncbi:amino acid adenylation domain-containing protein [Streptomyces sp. NBC_01387]|nr:MULTISPECIES: amino acid adenylation domain-containing protein [unclassified Streptomyces]MCX4551220.1 amino acid adenylation domain-containing protein [Streptomyces sp. NBC_01500]WSC22616.1 amino acid adenylation domain-containing protein [Streptomyces sp. NBC_01766]WSV56459.1 amino acid adenylation domain-containing protein [Streptomyces sp. NBC_01014]
MTEPSTLHERFREVATRWPDRCAVSTGTDAVTYGRLRELADELSDALAAELNDGEGLVALRIGRSVRAPAAVLGVLQSGRGYVPVDPDYPAARQQHILRDSGSALVVTDNGVDDDEVPVASVGPFVIARRPADPGRSQVPSGTAYVIYTSGSTGTPKGCLVGHEHVLGLFDAAGKVFDFGPDDVWTVFHNYSFDFSVWELWGALLHGGRAVMVGPAVAGDPAAFKELLAEESVSVLNQVPSVFGLLTQELELAPVELPRLRHVIFGGEALHADDIGRWNTVAAAPRAKLTNMYGTTETTVHVTYCELTEELLAEAPARTTPIGHPLPHLKVTLVDDGGLPVPDGEPGEMWVSGAGVSHGYLNRDALTAEKFVVTEDGRRCYRSGDQAVRRPDGNLYYVGRKDQQVKLRGFRIELGEVEAALRALPGIGSAACGVEENRHGDGVLIAYVVPTVGAPASSKDIRDALTACLPAHMRPQRIKYLTELPITPHGKLDRTALRTAVTA